ncbi:hypothetical protein [Saccharophagus degradans]|nr:hypothetical protein [Saccharophagus degradans]
MPVHKQMIENVANALGDEFRQQMTFVGGCTTGLLLTDEYTKEQVRHTDDVDLIVHTMGYVEFHQLQEKLKTQGFTMPNPAPGEAPPICAMQLGDLRVDFMPDDEGVLGFSNCWYKDAMQTAENYRLNPDLTIKLVTPVYFLATKLEAYKGRGNNDALSSRDIEDILNLVDGREELLGEVKMAPPELQTYISKELTPLLKDINFEYAVQSQAKGNAEREDLIFERLDTLSSYASDSLK